MSWLQHWLAIHLGIKNGGPDPFYNFWSGFGSDIGEVAIPAGVIAWWLHHTCHIHHCFRFGKHPLEGTPFVLCPKHHPEVPQKVTPQDLPT